MDTFAQPETEDIKLNLLLDRLTRATHGSDKELYTRTERTECISQIIHEQPDSLTDDELTNSFVSYWWDTHKSCRRCSICGRLMREGYCESMGYAYYCSDECLHTRFTSEEWEQECENDEQSYYTEW